MDIRKIRRLLVQEKIDLRFTDHAIIESRKDGLTTEDLEDAILAGEIIEDYGRRGLLLHFTKEDSLPCHVVLEYESKAVEAVVVTAYIPDATEWEPDWKRRRRKRRQ